MATRYFALVRTTNIDVDFDADVGGWHINLNDDIVFRTLSDPDVVVTCAGGIQHIPLPVANLKHIQDAVIEAAADWLEANAVNAELESAFFFGNCSTVTV